MCIQKCVIICKCRRWGALCGVEERGNVLPPKCISLDKTEIVFYNFYITIMGENGLKRIYLDNSATTKPAKKVLKAMKPYFSCVFGNESSSHSFGRDASVAVEKARSQVAKTLNTNTSSIYFTSSGSESNSWAIIGIAQANKHKGNHIITSKIEHDSVLNACKYLGENGFTVTYLPVNENGEILPESLESAITGQTILVSIMTANNEVGTINNIKELAKITHKAGAVFHTDAVQAYGILPLDVKDLNVDALSASGHKIYAPKGSAFLYVNNKVKIDNLIFGGNQEFGKRGGTLNTACIVGLGKACEMMQERMQKNHKTIIGLREYFISELIKTFGDKIQFNGKNGGSVPAIISVSLKNVDANIALISLDRNGVAVSRGSACTAGSSEPSYVISALGKPEFASKTIRFSLSIHTTKKEIDRVIKALKTIIK